MVDVLRRDLHSRKARKQSRVMGWLLRRQLSWPSWGSWESGILAASGLGDAVCLSEGSVVVVVVMMCQVDEFELPIGCLECPCTGPPTNSDRGWGYCYPHLDVARTSSSTSQSSPGRSQSVILPGIRHGWHSEVMAMGRASFNSACHIAMLAAWLAVLTSGIFAAA
jgi:hypothetical protein